MTHNDTMAPVYSTSTMHQALLEMFHLVTEQAEKNILTFSFRIPVEPPFLRQILENMLILLLERMAKNIRKESRGEGQNWAKERSFADADPPSPALSGIIHVF